MPNSSLRQPRVSLSYEPSISKAPSIINLQYTKAPPLQLALLYNNPQITTPPPHPTNPRHIKPPIRRISNVTNLQCNESLI